MPFYTRYLKPWGAFRIENELEPVLIEALVSSRAKKYAGTLDRVYRCGKDRCFYLADITTSKSNTKFVQMAGYKAAFGESYEPVTPDAKEWPMHLMTIRATNEGRFIKEVMKQGEDVAAWVTFLSCLNIHQWRKANNGSK
jgi:hypothetical protein